MAMLRLNPTFVSTPTVRLALKLFLLAILLTGCQVTSDTDKDFTPPLAALQQDPFHSARLSCFLTLKDDQGPAIRLEVASIEVIGDDHRLQLTSGPLTIDSTKIGTGQLFLGGLAVPPGRYHRLRLTVTKGEVRNDDGQYIVMNADPFNVELDLTANLVLEPEDSGSIFITWNLQKSLRSDNTLDLDLTGSPSLRQMLINLIFVSCPDIDTVFIVRADKNWVVDSFGLKGRPTYLAIDPVSSQLLYVLASRERMIKTVELSNQRVINFFPVPLNDEPTFMTISPDGQSAFLLDELSGYLSRIDLTTGRSEARVLLGDRPKYAAYLNAQNLLAVSLSLSQKVLLLDPVSLRLKGTITTGNAPHGLIISENQLFVAEYGDNSVSIADLASRGGQSRLSVGFGPRFLQETGDQIYVSNYLDGSLSVLIPGQSAVIQEIFGLGRPLEMVFNQSYLRLYVADEAMAALAVIDTNSNRLLGHIFLGAEPFDLEVIE